MKRGFTLVELSIVLVIIGLLIGGILAAQSMIGTAQIQGVVRQLQQYDVATFNFQTKYNQLPGDSDLFPNPGNNDGNVICVNEMGRFWYHLSLGVGLKNSDGTDFQSFTCAGTYTKSNCPRFSINQYIGNIPCLAVYYADYGSGSKNYYSYYAATNNILTNGATVDSFYPADALAIDKKIDNGLPTSGKVLANKAGSSTVGTCVTGTAYNATNRNFACIMQFELGMFN